MRRSLSLVIVLACVVCVLVPRESMAEGATAEKMELACRNWLAYIVHEEGSWAGSARPEIVQVEDIVADGVLLARCYSIAPRGHVIVANVKDFPRVWAYSEEDRMDSDETGELPWPFREGLHQALREFREGVAPPALEPVVEPPVPAETHSRGLHLMDPEEFDAALKAGIMGPLGTAGPLCSTKWHQRFPYNGFCPMGDQICAGGCQDSLLQPAYPTMVGCLATAVSQIMKKWEWPPHGVGKHTHAWDNDSTCRNSVKPGASLTVQLFDPYYWAAMPDTFNVAGKYFPFVIPSYRSVAELCYEVGVVLDMDYGVCRSSAPADSVITRLPRYFEYADSIVKVGRKAVHDTMWFHMIKQEINAGRPILYIIDHERTGRPHALVCDGWQDTGGTRFLHLNYGWGKSTVGWYGYWDTAQIPFSGGRGTEYMYINIKPPPMYVVGPGGDYATIQAAITAASDGYTVAIKDGTFSGVGNCDLNYGSKAITVRSRWGDPRNCIIDCGGSPSTPHRGVYFGPTTKPQAVLDGITIRNGYFSTAAFGGAVSCSGCSPTLTCCVFRDCQAGRGGGVSSTSSSDVKIKYCTFYSNFADYGGGFYASGGNPVLSHCTFSDNAAGSATAGGGIYLTTSSQMTMTNGIIVFSTVGQAVGRNTILSKATLSCCDLYNNAGGDWLYAVEGQGTVRGNMSQDPLFCGRPTADFRLNYASPCAFTNSGGCGLIGAWEAGCWPIVLPDHSGTFATIQDAINEAAGGGSLSWITLASGTFEGPGNRGIDFLGKSIILRSETGDPRDCIINCEGVDRGFIFQSGEGSECAIQGITIMNGEAEEGGAISCDWGSSPTIQGCIIQDNSATLSGGGLYCAEGSQPTIMGCTFSGNEAGDEGGAVFSCDSALPTLISCTLVGNTAYNYGGGIASTAESHVTAHNCIIAFNSAEAVYCSAAGTAALNCSDIYGNSADWDGCIYDQLGIDGNICEDPLFCGWETGYYSLDPESPCAPSDSLTGCDLMGAWGVGCDESSVPVTNPATPVRLQLARSVPNPFSSVTRVSYVIPGAARQTPVSLKVYNCLGQRVRTLVDEKQVPGVHMAVWDGKNDSGAAVASGVYFCRLCWNGDSRSQRMVLLR